MNYPPTDKVAHFGGGALVASVVDSIALVALHLLGLPIAFCVLAGVAAAFAAGRWKERRDAADNVAAVARGEYPPHGVEVADWQWTTWGSIVPAIPILAQLVASSL